MSDQSPRPGSSLGTHGVGQCQPNVRGNVERMLVTILEVFVVGSSPVLLPFMFAPPQHDVVCNL